MDAAENPYRPGAGTKPLVLAGREAEIVAKQTHCWQRFERVTRSVP